MGQWVDFRTLKEQVSMRDVLAHYGLLGEMQEKGREITGHCPLHDKGRYYRGAFSVSTTKNVWKCFICHRGGNVLDFVMALEGISIREAGKKLTEWLKAPTAQGREAQAESEQEERRTLQPLTFTLKLDSEHPYLAGRGLQCETIETFGVGYCKRGVMRGRIAIPIHNAEGELVAYCGRAVDDTEPPYKLPEGFAKSEVLFNLHRCRDAASLKPGIIVVEGCFDCMMVWQNGFKNAVAILGTELSESQECVLVDAVGSQGKVTLLLDGDAAGRTAAEAITERLVRQCYVRRVDLPDGKDPAELDKAMLAELLTG